MVKSLLILLFMLVSMQAAQAKQFIQGTVEAVEIGVMDETGAESLCITYLYSEAKNKTYAVVEDIYDCYYAREFNEVIGSTQRIPSSFLFRMYQELEQHLADSKGDALYLFSEVE